MPRRWLEEQDDAIKHWLAESKCPMLVSKEAGGFLWVNEATESLFGYSSAEFLGQGGTSPVSWQVLTIDQQDLHADNAMVAQMVAGDRSEYTLEKSYRAKSGKPIPCRIHVLRWPPNGDADCFLVTIIPFNAEQNLLKEELMAMKKALSQLVDAQHAKRPSALIPLLKSFGSWANQNKIPFACLVLWVSAMVAGDKVLIVAERLKDLFFSP